MIACVAGNPSIDKHFEVEAVTPGEIHRPLEFLQVPGGKGLNVARGIATLGERVIATGLLAGHTGRWVEQALGAEGIEGCFEWTAGETRSSLSVADRQTGRLTEFYEAGVPITAEDWSRLTSLVVGLLPRASWLSLSGSVPPGGPESGYAALVQAAHRAGVPAAVDTHDRLLARAIAAGAELVKINMHEAADLLGTRLATVPEVHAAAAEIRRRQGGGGRATVVTMGAEGTVLVDSDGQGWLGRPRVRGRYPVGSGDVFLAGLLVGRRRGGGWTDALRLALGAGAANAMQPGAGRLDPGVAERQAADAEIQRLGG
jgi:1-phosphofructokinase family hexose kinase